MFYIAWKEKRVMGMTFLISAVLFGGRRMDGGTIEESV